MRADARGDAAAGRAADGACPGMVLGLGYIFFFNHPRNPLNFLYGTMTILVLSTIVHYYTSSHLTAVTALKAIDNEFESVSASLKVPFYKTFFRVTVPVCLPAILDIGRYLFVNAMVTLSAVVFLYSPDTKLASVAIVNLDEAGDIGPAAAMATLIVATSTVVCLVYALLTRLLLTRTQAWRSQRRPELSDPDTGKPHEQLSRDPDPADARSAHDVAADQDGDAARLGLVGSDFNADHRERPRASCSTIVARRATRTCACRCRAAARSRSRRPSTRWCRATATCWC